MRKISSIVFLVCILTIQTLYAQYETRPRLIEVGFFGGPTIMWASPKTIGFKNEGAKIGGVYGVSVDINLAQPMQNYYFHTGINARHIRSELSFFDTYVYNDKSTDSAHIRSVYNMAYLSIPVAIKLKTDPFGRFVIFGLVGMDNSICVSSKSNDNIKKPSIDQDYAKINNYKKTFFLREALLVSVGVDFIIKGNTKASFAFAFNNGFTNEFRKSYINKLGDKPHVKAQTRGFEFQFGFIF